MPLTIEQLEGRVRALEQQMGRAVRYGAVSAPGGSQVFSQAVVAGSVSTPQAGVGDTVGGLTGIIMKGSELDFYSAGNTTALKIFAWSGSAWNNVLTLYNSGGNAVANVASPGVAFYIQPQAIINGLSDSPQQPNINIGSIQTTNDAGGTSRTYYENLHVAGSTQPIDYFTTGGSGAGANYLVSRRAGIVWSGAFTGLGAGCDVSFFFRFSVAPSSISYVVVAESLNGATVATANIDAFGFQLKISDAAGAGYTCRRWSTSGGG
jgi:hypothetical protein